MTGPEHYREAERQARLAQAVNDPAAALVMAQLATAYATLALTAATAMQAGVDGSEPGMGRDEYMQWYIAAGVKPTRPGARDDEDYDDGFSASEVHEMDQRDEAVLDAEAGESL